MKLPAEARGSSEAASTGDPPAPSPLACAQRNAGGGRRLPLGRARLREARRGGDGRGKPARSAGGGVAGDVSHVGLGGWAHLRALGGGPPAAALEGLDVDGLLAGARAMDEATRVEEARKNPAALLALMWHHAGRGRGQKDDARALRVVPSTTAETVTSGSGSPVSRRTLPRVTAGSGRTIVSDPGAGNRIWRACGGQRSVSTSSVAGPSGRPAMRNSPSGPDSLWRAKRTGGAGARRSHYRVWRARPSRAAR